MPQLTIHVLELIVCVLSLTLIYRLYSLSKRPTSLGRISQHQEVHSAEDDEVIVVEEHTSILQIVERAISDIDKEIDTTKNYESKIESLKLAQRFASSQLCQVNENFALKKIVETDWLNEVSSLYIIGAIDFIGKHTQCDIQCRKELIQLVLKSNELAPNGRTLKYFSNITKRAYDENNEHLILAGAKAAKMWLDKHTVPTKYRLNEQLGWWRYDFITSRINKKMPLAQ